MSVLMIIFGTLIVALLAIGIAGGLIVSVVSIVRLVSGKRKYRGELIDTKKRWLFGLLCVLNALCLTAGTCLGVWVYQEHKAELWSIVSTQSEKDNILPDFLQDGDVSDGEVQTETPYTIYQNQNIQLPIGTATYVLVPGGGHDAWCYEPVKQLLEAAGQDVYAVSLPGVGELADELTAETSLDDHINAVADYIVENDLNDVILVGHSYGGMVITGAADRVPKRIRKIVYLDAVHLADNQSLLDAQPLVQYVPAVSQPPTVNGVEVNLYPDEETIAFLGLTAPVDVAYASEHLTPHPWKTFTQTLHLKKPNIVNDVGKTDIYTKATLDGLLTTGIVTPEDAAAVMVIDTGHDLMITEPELTADMLLNAATNN